MGEENSGNLRGKLLVTMQLINVFIGIIIALICVVAYVTIDTIYIKEIVMGAAVIFGIICFISLYKRLHRKEKVNNENNISKIELVNEDNEIMKYWYIEEKTSFLIGKRNEDNEVLIDLSNSIYSQFIEEIHAVFNYAAGKWFVEDLSEKSEVCIQKIDDNTKYKIVKDIPCELKKGDILYISKVKLLLR